MKSYEIWNAQVQIFVLERIAGSLKTQKIKNQIDGWI